MKRRTLALENTAVYKGILGLQKVILIATGSFSAVLVTFNILCRYIFKVDVFAVDEIIKLVTMWMYFIGASYCSAVEGHITANLLGPMIKSGVRKKILKLTTEFITIFVQCFFTVWGIRYIIWCVERNGKTPGLGLPLVASQLSLVVGIVMMLFYTVVRMLGYLKTPAAEYVEADLSSLDGKEENS